MAVAHRHFDRCSPENIQVHVRLDTNKNDEGMNDMAREVFIIAASRTPIGAFGGALAPLPATALGAAVIRSVIERAGIEPGDVEEVLMGNVLSAGQGQAPARQAALAAGLSHGTICTTVSKVCASGLKAITLGAGVIALGNADVVVAGGMESMSNVPHYIDVARFGIRAGHGQLTDGMLKDGLWDPYHDYHMGSAAEVCARVYGITRQEQDSYAAESYRRAIQAGASGRFDQERVPVMVPGPKGSRSMVAKDEQPDRVNFDKMPGLKPAFEEGGTVTAANASSVNDGAAAVVLVSGDYLRAHGLRPLARLAAYADAAQAPEWFTTSPSIAIPKALARAGMAVSDLEYIEINEAYAVVAIANNRLLDLDPERVNINGGAVALGHPIGCSGARIVVTLLSVLQQRDATLGAAAVCNGGGGATALVIERL